MPKKKGAPRAWLNQEVCIGSDYSDEEQDFIRAVRKWQETSKSKFPAFSDYLRILKSLGYRKMTADMICFNTYLCPFCAGEIVVLRSLLSPEGQRETFWQCRQNHTGTDFAQLRFGLHQEGTVDESPSLAGPGD